MKYKYKNQLPDKPSELIRRALQDMEAVEKMPQYRINLSTWHEPKDDVCEVCLAGATMAAEGLPLKMEFLPSQFDDKTSDKLHALNFLRFGWIYDAFDCLEIDFPESIDRYVCITDYEDSPKQFKSDMYKLADYLEQKGY